MKRYSTIVAITLLVIAGFIVYSNSLSGKFIWDDEYLVKNNAYIRNFSYITQIFTHNIGSGAYRDYYVYRPLQIIVYSIDYHLGRLNVTIYHLTNILLHISVGLLIYWLINLLFSDILLAFFSSLLFIIHPVHTEAVAYISGQADPLVGVFMMFCFILYIKYIRKESRIIYLAVLLSYVFALLSRENAGVIIVLFLLYHYTFSKKIRFKLFIPITIVTLVYIAFRFTLFVYSMPVNTTVVQRLPGFFVALFDYVRLLVLPYGLHMLYGLKLFHFNNPEAIMGITILCVLLYILIKKKNNHLIFFSLSWFILVLMPQSNLYPINAYMAEHWLYLPSIGFFLIVAKFITDLYRTKHSKVYATIFVLSLFMFYSYLTIKQNRYWKEPVVFYERILRYANDNPLVYNNLGKAYYNNGKVKKAEILFKKALSINPNDTDACYNLGIVYRSIGESTHAIEMFNKVIAMDPHYARAYNNLGLVYYEKGNKDKAANLYKKAIEIYRLYYDAYYNLANVYYDKGEEDKAISLYEEVLKINPYDYDACNNLGLIYYKNNRKNEAATFFRRAIAIDSHRAKAYNNLGLVYSDMGKTEYALSVYKKAIKVDHNFVDAYNNMGIVYGNNNDFDNAVKQFKKAIEINRDYAKAYNNLAIVYYRQKKYNLSIKYAEEALRRGFVNPSLLKALQLYR